MNSNNSSTVFTTVPYIREINDTSTRETDETIAEISIFSQCLKNRVMHVILGLCVALIMSLVFIIVIILRKSHRSSHLPQPSTNQFNVGQYYEINELAIPDHVQHYQTDDRSHGTSETQPAQPREPYHQLRNVTVKDVQESTYTGLGTENEDNATPTDIPQRENYEEVSRLTKGICDYAPLNVPKMNVLE